MSSLIETIEQVSKDVGIRSFVYADFETEQEFQSVIEKFKFEEYPLLLIPPFNDAGVWTNGRRKGILQIRGWVLKRVSHDTNNYRSRSLEVTTIEPMKHLAKKFNKNIIDSVIADPLVSNVSDSVRGSYQFTNKHLFGASFTINLPITEIIC